MDWKTWYENYDTSLSLLARLKLVCEELDIAITNCPSNPVTFVSLCAGDGRDILRVLHDHPRRREVNGWLIDNHPGSVQRGRQGAELADLHSSVKFILADAALAKTYKDIPRADILLISGFLGHLRNDTVPHFIRCLPMLCNSGATIIWNRHLELNDGARQVPAIRMLFQTQNFEEHAYREASRNGFAVSRVCFQGVTIPLHETEVFFDFVGVDALGTENRPG